MPNSTKPSLLQKAKRDQSSEAWFQLNAIYEPLIAGWIARTGIRESDVGDIAQDVMLTLAKELANFDHNGRVGAFRKWLKLITINRCRRYWDTNKRQIAFNKPLDTESGAIFLDGLEDPSSDISKLWDQEYDSYVLGRMVQLVEKEFDKRDYDIFRRNTLDGESAKAIANELGISVGNIYKIKFRVLSRLKDVASGLLDQPAAGPISH